jgi:diguanylate cyclase (GGDEF)-like protein
MRTAADGEPIALQTRGESIHPDSTSYVLTSETEIVLIDPGTASHLRHHWSAIKPFIGSRLTVILLAPGFSERSSLEMLEEHFADRRLIFDRPALSDPSVAEPWEPLLITHSSTAIEIAADWELQIVRLPSARPVGNLLCYDQRSRTLFTGALFGSIGEGRDTTQPVLRRESVKAYTDLYTPGLSLDRIVAALDELELARIAPTRGRPVPGGIRLVERLFAKEPAEDRQPFPFGFYRRLAALTGPAAADSLFKSAGLEPPDSGTGFETDIPADAQQQIDMQVERWLSADVRRALDAYREAQEGAASDPQTGSTEQSTRRAHRNDAPAFNELTGLPGESKLRELIREKAAIDTPIVVMLISVDGIEGINRRFGRTGGDDALYAVSYLVSNFQRLQDSPEHHHLFKLGGPLFCCLIEDTTITRAEEIAEALRETIANSAMFLEQITVSIGVVGSGEAAPGRPSSQPVLPESRLLAHATMRLRLAQGSGMNTVCATDPEISGGLSAGKSVLLADPDTPYLSILSHQLDERGFSVMTADDGESALEIIEQIVPDAIVCELMLPKLNGFALRDELRRSSRLSDIPFVAVSHRKNDEEVQKAAARGIVHFLQKPFSLIELTGLLGNLTEGGER